ncbi:hypothetical protein AVT69_gp062 [Pseudomonas phage PhiPA3]|uniref:Uncharacterized protein 061 n=1 Tax=Pseudomonas phage PhiPA3 TaxID=998086 RepID=F8SJU3_BPPA3|nr:hypothetical protein AVT69_gp062 [Pseudomonas phage PhiPA3]AEH03488.1 hypothetical protein [Pseudomonas phage PhiPA3]
MSQQPNAPALNAFSVMSTWLSADPVEGAQKRPSLRFGVFGNVPRISVKTNVPNDLNNGKIDFRCDLATFAAAMTYADDLVNDKPGVPQERKFIFQDDFVAGKKMDKVIPITSLVIGREASTGRIYIAVLSTQQQRPKIKFYFGPSKFHNILNGDGSQISPKEMSEAYAAGFLKPATAIVYHMMVSAFDPNAKNVANPANFNGGGNGGGNNYNRGNGGGNYNRGNNGGGNGGYQKPSSGGFSDSGFDDEIPNF